MELKLEKAIALPIVELNHAGSEVWDSESVVFESAKFYSVNAASGMGKTTLLSMLFGIRKDYNGNIFINNENVRNFDLNKWTQIRRSKLSFVFQGLRLFPELTALENILIKNKLTGFKSEKEIKEMAELLNITPLLNQRAEFLSFGQQQRFAILRSLCQPLEFLLLDEPFSHLDAGNINLCIDLITQECRKQGAGMILTSLEIDYNFKFDKILKM